MYSNETYSFTAQTDEHSDLDFRMVNGYATVQINVHARTDELLAQFHELAETNPEDVHHYEDQNFSVARFNVGPYTISMFGPYIGNGAEQLSLTEDLTN
jgi:hypothetical protein